MNHCHQTRQTVHHVFIHRDLPYRTLVLTGLIHLLSKSVLFFADMKYLHKKPDSFTVWNSTHSAVTLHILSGVIKMDRNFSAAFSIWKDHSNYLSNLSHSISRCSIKNIKTFFWAFLGFWTSITMSRYYTDGSRRLDSVIVCSLSL